MIIFRKLFSLQLTRNLSGLNRALGNPKISSMRGAINVQNKLLGRLAKGKTMLDNKINKFNQIASNPGQSAVNGISYSIRHPVQGSIKAIETAAELSNINPIPILPSVSKYGKHVENKFNKKTRLGLSLKADKFSKSKFAEHTKNGINAVVDYGKLLIN